VASQDANQDLFWALKGGMNRFGIVTSAVLETHPQPSQVYVSFSPTGCGRRISRLAKCGDDI
jgi:FAD/FMN-containing dehydrogenase